MLFQFFTLILHLLLDSTNQKRISDCITNAYIQSSRIENHSGEHKFLLNKKKRSEVFAPFCLFFLSLISLAM